MGGKLTRAQSIILLDEWDVNQMSTSFISQSPLTSIRPTRVAHEMIDFNYHLIGLLMDKY